MPEELPECPKCKSDNVACVKIPGTGYTCKCIDCGNDWTEIKTVAGATVVLIGLWLLLCLAFFVSIAMLKKGGV